MKLNTLDHPKTLDLCDRLNAGLAQTLGHLTLLWAFTARKSPRGDVGKWTDGAIARACDWQGDSAAFVNALVESGYLDRDDEYRLLVHDWPDHAERWVKASLKNLNQTFIVRTTGPTTVETTGPTDDATPCPDLPSPAKPKARARKCALPSDFAPKDSHKQLAAEKGVSLETEFEQFCDHHAAKGSTMADWDRALNTWLRNAKKFGGSKPANEQLWKLSDSELIDRAKTKGIGTQGKSRQQLIAALEAA